MITSHYFVLVIIIFGIELNISMKENTSVCIERHRGYISTCLHERTSK